LARFAASRRLDPRRFAAYNATVFSLPKLIVLAAILFAIWYGLRWFARINRIARTIEQRQRAAMGGEPQTPPVAAARTQELVACPVCGTYVAPSAPSCGRVDCPGALGHRGA
jgi:hypothetical protein